MHFAADGNTFNIEHHELFKNKNDTFSTSCLGITLVLWQYTISENLEMLAYLYWPSLLFMGTFFASNDSGRISSIVLKDGGK